MLQQQHLNCPTSYAPYDAGDHRPYDHDHHVLYEQCDQIGLFLKATGDTIYYKSSPNIRQLFGLFWKTSQFKQTL